MLQKTLESPSDCKEIKPVHHKENQPWIFIRRTEAEAPIIWPPDVKSWLTGKDSDAGKDWGQEKQGWQRMRWLDGIIDSMDMNVSKLGEIAEDRAAWYATVHGVSKSRPHVATEQESSQVSLLSPEVLTTALSSSATPILCSSSWSLFFLYCSE